MKQRLDIFDLLKRINKGDMAYIDSLDAESLKQFEPYVVQLWLRGAIENQSVRVRLTNECVNPYVFSLGKHPKLLYKLMCAANSIGDDTRYRFIKKTAHTRTKAVKMVCEYYGYSPAQARDALELLDNDALVEMAQSLGYDEKEIKEIIK